MGDERPIGSYFEHPDASLLRGAELASHRDEIFVESGRQALRLVALSLESQGLFHVVLPNYLCESMVSPFPKNTWRVSTYELDEHLEPKIESMTARPSKSLWLLAPYFGRHLPRGIADWVRERRATGDRIVLDQTHSLLAPDPTPVDYQVASLRKVFPVAIGGMVKGDIHASTDNYDSGLTALAIQSMNTKSRELAGRANPGDGYSAFTELERRLCERSAPRLLDPKITAQARSLDLDTLRQRRVTNATTLASALESCQGIIPLRGMLQTGVPAYLACRTTSPRALQARLATRQIYCPIHWPYAEGLQRRDWPNDLISLPVDHRYSAADMERVAREVQNILGEQ
jgi:hypothetical protein